MGSTTADPEPVRALEPGAVEVWRAPLDLTDERRAALFATLSGDERERAARFAFERERNRFIAGRGTLRLILASCLGCGPAELRFDYGPRGKPALGGAARASGVFFNLAHSHGRVVYAVTRGRTVGVDLEKVRPEVEHERLAQRYFAPGEVAALAALPAEERRRAFFTCWTRKEGYLKATGDGLATPLDSFEVPLAPGATAALVCHRTDPGEVARWSLADLDAGPDYAAALVTEGAAAAIRYRDVAAARTTPLPPPPPPPGPR